MSSNCYKCQENLILAVGTNILRSEECPKCHTDLHCCKMCELYSVQSYNECKESIADRIVDKEKANFCDHFKLRANTSAANSKQSILDAANALFKK